MNSWNKIGMAQQVLAKTLLLQSYPNPRKPELEELFIAYLLTKQLCDLCETGCAVIKDLPKDQRENLPSKNTLTTLNQILSQWYSPDMFLKSKRYGLKPDWAVLKSFAPLTDNPAWILYLVIVDGITPEIIQAVQDRNQKYFYNNFDTIFSGLPEILSKSINPFKNFIHSNAINEDDRDIIWDFFDEITTNIVDRQIILNDLKSQRP